jgi:hypothetical protein
MPPRPCLPFKPDGSLAESASRPMSTAFKIAADKALGVAY